MITHMPRLIKARSMPFLILRYELTWDVRDDGNDDDTDHDFDDETDHDHNNNVMVVMMMMFMIMMMHVDNVVDNYYSDLKLL